MGFSTCSATTQYVGSIAALKMCSEVIKFSTVGAASPVKTSYMYMGPASPVVLTING